MCHRRKADGLQSGYTAMISERGVVYTTKKMGPSTEPSGTPSMRCDGDENEFLTEVDWYLSEMYD